MSWVVSGFTCCFHFGSEVWNILIAVLDGFYPRDAMLEQVIAVATCLSVCPSVTAGIVSKWKQLASWFLHHLIAPWFHSQARYDSSKNTQGSPPARAISESGVGSNGRFFMLRICLSEPTTKIRMNIDPYNQRQKCTPKIAVSSNIRFMRIFLGVRLIFGLKWEWKLEVWSLLPSSEYRNIVFAKMFSLTSS